MTTAYRLETAASVAFHLPYRWVQILIDEAPPLIISSPAERHRAFIGISKLVRAGATGRGGSGDFSVDEAKRVHITGPTTSTTDSENGAARGGNLYDAANIGLFITSMRRCARMRSTSAMWNTSCAMAK